MKKSIFTIIRLLYEKYTLKQNNSLTTLNFSAIDGVHAYEGAALKGGVLAKRGVDCF